MRIRDPIHGTVWVSDDEARVVDSPFYQRLRHIRQLGFGDLAFPGATHTRHAHSLGAMHVASRLFDAVANRADLTAAAAQRFRTAVRLSVLCHDLGHMPLSHASEAIAPPLESLALPAWLHPPDEKRKGKRASHEDFTAKILLSSSLSEVLQEGFSSKGISPEAVTALITGAQPPRGLDFENKGVDWSPLLRALVSGELDADRMDYLIRDSFYTGVNYGRYDLDWIVNNLCPAQKGGCAYLALSRAAAFAFEDFLLSRYHMFVSVYYHHTSVGFDYMLRRYYEEAPGEFEIPAEPEAFLLCDDSALMYTLRRSKNRWAQRIVGRRGFKLLAQFTERDEGYDLMQLSRALQEAAVEHFSVESKGVLSHYFEAGRNPPLYILDLSTGRLTDVDKYTPLYQRYSGPVRLWRVYVQPDQLPQASDVLNQIVSAAQP